MESCENSELNIRVSSMLNISQCLQPCPVFVTCHPLWVLLGGTCRSYSWLSLSPKLRWALSIYVTSSKSSYPYYSTLINFTPSSLGNLCTLWRGRSRNLSLLACICGNFRSLAVENNFGLFEVTSCIYCSVRDWG